MANVVPDRVMFRVDRRIVPEEDPPQVESALRQLLEASADELNSTVAALRG